MRIILYYADLINNYLISPLNQQIFIKLSAFYPAIIYDIRYFSENDLNFVLNPPHYWYFSFDFNSIYDIVLLQQSCSEFKKFYSNITKECMISS